MPFIGKHSTVIFYEAALYNVSVGKNTQRHSRQGYSEALNIRSSKDQKRFRSVDIETTTQFTTTKQIDVYTEKLPTVRHVNKSSTIGMSQSIKLSKCHNPINHVAFLKVHKASSTTVMNIFLRYGDSHRLNIVLPKSVKQSAFNYLGYGVTVQKKRINKIPSNETYNILCNHAVFDKEAFAELLGPHSFNIGIVRDPFTHFPSAAYYYGLLSRIKKRFSDIKDAEELLSIFLKTPDSFGSILHIHNGMFSDFGLPKKDFYNEEAINKGINDLDKEFALVMVTELFDESLILMRRILCWEIKDILYVPLNINKKKKKNPIVLTEDTKKNLFKYNYADFKLYMYFRDKLLEQIKDEGDDFYSEVRYFKKVHVMVTKFCNESYLKKFSSSESILIKASVWNKAFTINSQECKFMMSSELPLLKGLMSKAETRYNNWLEKTFESFSGNRAVFQKRNVIS
ncbi:GAL3ST1 [Mytilus coruscus]|uniref:GAL3ST1 n=1 Tax=Mytilus coruscus TaxID=42192 RepID=A0A6J8D507_MYTCO|nr:GAL3ST1 [Mytilus coruscus]